MLIRFGLAVAFFAIPLFFNQFLGAFNIYPGGYAYERISGATGTYIYKFNLAGQIEETYTYMYPNLIDVNGKEVKIWDAERIIKATQRWRELIMIPIGVILGLLCTIIIPKRIINETHPLPMKKDLKEDFPRISKTILRKGFLRRYAVLGIGLSFYWVYRLMQQYPAEEVEVLKEVLNYLD